MFLFSSSAPRATRVVASIALAAVVACAIYLIFGPKPWVAGLGPAEAAGEKLDVSHYRVSGVWFASLANLLLACVVLLFAPWFARSHQAKAEEFAIGACGRPTRGQWRWVWGAVLLAMAITLTGALPRLGHGLWHDEDKTIRNFVVGQHLRSATSGELKYREVTWEETIWSHRTPNHTLYGITARVIHSLWPPKRAPELPYLNESALRLPALLGGLGGLAALAVMLALLGFPRAAVIAPILLSVHPWFLRYASEARGYALLFLFGPLCVVLLVKALSDGRWRWWIGLALSQFLIVYAVLNALYLLLFVNLAALLWIWSIKHRRAVLLRRWVLCNVVTAALGLQFMLAFVPQFKAYVDRTQGDSSHLYNETLIKDNLANFAAGMRYPKFNDNQGGASLKSLMEDEQPVITILLCLVVFASVIAGCIQLCRRGRNGIALLAICLLPAPLFLLHSWLSAAHIFYWYTILSLPFFWALFAIGAGAFSSKLPQLRADPSGMATATLSGIAAAALLFWVSWPQRQFQVSHPIESNREAVYDTRSILDPFDPRYGDVLTINVYRHPMVYDGAAPYAANVAEFREWLSTAERTGKPLFVIYNPSTGKAQRARPKIMALVDDPNLFETVSFYPGADTGTDRVVKRYLPQGEGSP